MPRYYKETCSTDKARPVEYEVKTKDADASLLYLILQSLQVMKKQSWETSRNNAEVYGVIFGYGDEDADDGAERISDGLASDITEALKDLHEVILVNHQLSIRLRSRLIG